MGNGNNGNHGVKGKSGRKPKAITLLKRQLVANGVEDAEYAYSLFVSIMRDETAELALRKDCAREVMDRVLGKPKQDMGINAAIAVDDVTKLSADERKQRIAELLERRARAGATGTPGS